MLHQDLVSRMVTTCTGRTPDQHALDPVTAAADVNHAAGQLRDVRHDLLLAVDTLRTLLINGDDLDKPTSGTIIDNHLAAIDDEASKYRRARRDLDTLLQDPERMRHANCNPPRDVYRHYVSVGRNVLVIAPYSTPCCNLGVAGRPTWVTVHTQAAELLGLPAQPRETWLRHHEAGIYHDAVVDQLYVLRTYDPTDQHR